MSSASIKNVKKEEVDDDEDDNFLSSLAQRKKKNQSNGHGDVRSKTLKVKKEELEDDEDEKPIIKKIPNKGDKDKKKKNKRREEERGDKANRQKHKEKKVYNLPGQKHDPPEKRDPLRIFYESLHEQISSSEMAAFWMMERGLLPLLEAKRCTKRSLKRIMQTDSILPTNLLPLRRLRHCLLIRKIHHPNLYRQPTRSIKPPRAQIAMMISSWPRRK